METYGSVKWETLLMERILLQQLESEMEGKSFRGIMSFLTSRAPAQVYVSCVESSMIHRNETRLLLADVGLKQISRICTR